METSWTCPSKELAVAPKHLSFCLSLLLTSVIPLTAFRLFPPCPVLSKLLRLVLKTFHVLGSICLSFFFLYCLCMFLHYGKTGLRTKYTLLFPSPSIFPCCPLFLKCPSLISNSQNPTAILDEASLISPIIPHLLSPHILPFSELP